MAATRERFFIVTFPMSVYEFTDAKRSRNLIAFLRPSRMTILGLVFPMRNRTNPKTKEKFAIQASSFSVRPAMHPPPPHCRTDICRCGRARYSCAPASVRPVSHAALPQRRNWHARNLHGLFALPFLNHGRSNSHSSRSTESCPAQECLSDTHSKQPPARGPEAVEATITR